MTLGSCDNFFGLPFPGGSFPQAVGLRCALAYPKEFGGLLIAGFFNEFRQRYIHNLNIYTIRVLFASRNTQYVNKHNSCICKIREWGMI